jgi:UDP-N-acetyl-D-glucosamine dehydrogenase
MMHAPALPTVDVATSLRGRLTAGTASVVVVGLGYVGLSLAVALGRAGFRVTGIEVDLARVAAVRQGQSYVTDVASLDVAALVSVGRLSATTAHEGVGEADAIVICVPTPLRKSRDPDISFILTALDGIVPHLRPGQLVVLESTTYPGTTGAPPWRRCSMAT